MPARAWVHQCYHPFTPHFQLPQVLADTGIFGPLHVAGYFTFYTLVEGGGLPDVAAKLRTDFWPTFSAELFVWPAVQVSQGSCSFVVAASVRVEPFQQRGLGGWACRRTGWG